MRHIEPPENLPVVPTPAPTDPKTPETETKEDVHFRDQATGGTVTEPNNGDRCLGECPSTIKEAFPMEHNDAQSATSAAFMTANELAAWLGVTRYSVYALVRKDGMPCYRYSGMLRFKVGEVQRFLKSRRVPSDRYARPQD